MKKKIATEEDLADIRMTGIQYLLDLYCRRERVKFNKALINFEWVEGFTPVTFSDKILTPNFDPFQRGDNGSSARENLRIIMQLRAKELGVSFRLPDNYSQEITEILRYVQDYSNQRYEELQALKKRRELVLIRSPELLLDLYTDDAVILLTGDCGAGKSFLVDQFRSRLENLTTLVGFSEPYCLERCPRTMLHVVDPDEFLGDGDWEGEVPEEEADPTMGFALDKLKEVLLKPGIVIITDAGPNRGQREAILRLIKQIRPGAEVHAVLVETASLVSIARNWTRKRNVPHNIWLRVHLEYKNTFYRMVKSGAYPRWEVYDGNPSWYEDLLYKYYRCSYIAPSGRDCTYQSIPSRSQGNSEYVLPLPVMGMGEQWFMVKRQIYCYEHHPCSHVATFSQRCSSFAHSKLFRCGQFCGSCMNHCPHKSREL